MQIWKIFGVKIRLFGFWASSAHCRYRGWVSTSVHETIYSRLLRIRNNSFVKMTWLTNAAGTFWSLIWSSAPKVGLFFRFISDYYWTLQIICINVTYRPCAFAYITHEVLIALTRIEAKCLLGPYFLFFVSRQHLICFCFSEAGFCVSISHSTSSSRLHIDLSGSEFHLKRVASKVPSVI